MKKIFIFLILSSFITTIIPYPSYSLEKMDEKSINKKSSFLSAEFRVQMLANRSENTRKNYGLLFSGLGLTMMVLSPHYSFEASLSRAYLYYGATLAAIGVDMYFVPTGIENDFKGIERIPQEEKGERELLAEKSLQIRSEQAGMERVKGSILLGILGLLLIDASLSLTGVHLVLAGCNYFIKTGIEMEYEEYLRDKEGSKKAGENYQLIQSN